MMSEIAQDTRFIPSTQMADRYVEVQAEAHPGATRSRGDRTRQQRELAERDLGAIADLARSFLESVQEFEEYEPRAREGFYDYRPPLGEAWREPGDPITDRIAARMYDEGIEACDGLPSLRYIDREIVPSRTTSPFERSAGSFVRLDLLLATGQTPVVAEVKALGDENAYYALIQGLTACAQLAPRAQRQRLSDQYEELSTSGPQELWIVLSEHNSRGKDKAAMLDLSREIAVGLVANPDLAKFVTAIRCVDATIPPDGPVGLSERWSALASD